MGIQPIPAIPLRRRLMLACALVTLVSVGPSRLDASVATDARYPAVITRGAGPGVVLLAGLLGGTARLQPLADTLARRGYRVVVIDPYRLGAVARDVSFDGLAREVAAVLAREGMTSAVVVAHSHATSIAVRLAANAPWTVHQLILLDGGVLESTRSPGVARALQMASIIAMLPGGTSFLRSRLTGGIRANSGDPRWLSPTIERQYVDPILAELGAVTRMARRLADAREPESVDAVLKRVQAPVTVLSGGTPHETAPAADELSRLRVLPAVHLRQLNGVGHFVHEEALPDVVREVEAANARRLAAAR